MWGWVYPAAPSRVAAGQRATRTRTECVAGWSRAAVGSCPPGSRAVPTPQTRLGPRTAPAAGLQPPARGARLRRALLSGDHSSRQPPRRRVGRWRGGDARYLLGAVVSAPGGAVWPLPGAAGPPGAVGGGGGGCARGRRRRGERGHGRGAPGRVGRRGSPPDGDTADLEHPARVGALGASGVCPARRSRRCGRPQGPARSGRRPGCPSARPGKGRGGPQGRARRRQGVPVSLEGCSVSMPAGAGGPCVRARGCP